MPSIDLSTFPMPSNTISIAIATLIHSLSSPHTLTHAAPIISLSHTYICTRVSIDSSADRISHSSYYSRDHACNATS